jgi:hypothetical protein
MELYSKTKIVFLTLTVCIVFSFFFTETLAASSLDHDCTGEGCPFCMEIEIANNFLKTLKLAGIILFFALFLMFPARTLYNTELSPCLYSPITLKIRFNS